MLSQRSRYALRSLIMLASHHGKGPVQTGKIAEQQRVPRKFLELILLDMKHAGLVESMRGKAGGYLLAKPPEEVSFGEVIRLLDGPLALVPCASLNFYQHCADCQDEATCSIRHAMLVVREETARVLEGFSLADALKREGGVDIAQV